MAAISTLQVREQMHAITKRNNWAGREAGVVLVFCIVFIVAAGLLSLFLHKRIVRRRAEKEAKASRGG
jgi:hypothetical protein